MKASSNITGIQAPQLLHRGAGRVVLCLLVGLSGALADLIEPPAEANEAPAAPAEVSSAKPAASEPPPAPEPEAPAVPAPPTNTPSRFIAGTEVSAYVKSLAGILNISGRATDPFGQFQDPDAKPIIKPTVAKDTKRVATAQSTPFAEIIGLIQINTIMPGEKRFLIETRSFKQGDTFPINFRGRSIRTQVTKVDAREIQFRNIESGETAAVTLKLLPVGMIPGSGALTPPGMVPQIPNAPIDLDPGDANNTHP
jgi:pyruvate/2-oxoglutarate dehydrogenase complex dihydrolipoamide acyltransferase (E2) component